MDDSSDEFVRPPEAPVFRPTEEEFEDPMKYIESIRPVAERYGICKIIPPPSWNPPFCIDVDDFRFTPRVQQLNKLDAKTRLKVQWLEKLQVFWSMHQKLEVPEAGDKPLDLYKMDKFVRKEVKDVCDVGEIGLDRWEALLVQLGLGLNDDFDSSDLKSIYEEMVMPMNRFTSSFLLNETDEATDNDEKENTSPLSPLKASPKKKIFSPLKSLPKVFMGEKVRAVGFMTEGKCPTCRLIDLEAEVCVKCTSCGELFHRTCVQPQPRTWSPDFNSQWCCRNCAIKKLSEANTLSFGFMDSKKLFSLFDFGEHADTFKMKYFQKEPASVPTEEVERHFWKLITSPHSAVKVMYGADIHALKQGSGFPTLNGLNNHPVNDPYIYNGWNLNNLPDAPDSLLKFITAAVSGMKVPWMYAGMCFSSFCWHNEDHWTYSINYLHLGEPKTWYGVSGLDADRFEARMKEVVPKLFKCQPDLLHQLVTMLNPAVLMAGGVDVFRTDQEAGQFVITFPRAYHAGFNQGFNFAEAVNFASTSWLPYGFQSIAQYSDVKRPCVFSQEEMLCEMARQVSTLDLGLAREVCAQLSVRLVELKAFWYIVTKLGLGAEVQVMFEKFGDDDRSCAHCYTTVFLCSVACGCSRTTGRKIKSKKPSPVAKRVCIRHIEFLCSCSPSRWQLQYRYTIEELEEMINSLEDRIAKLKGSELSMES